VVGTEPGVDRGRGRWNDGTAEDVGIAVISVQPKGIAEHGERLVAVFFQLSKDAAQDGLNSEGGNNTGSEAGSVDLLRDSAAGELIVDARVATERGKAPVAFEYVPISRAVTGVFGPAPR
jgi:hypothetical protein